MSRYSMRKIVICSRCKKNVEVTLNYVNKFKYCSRRCYYLSRRGKPTWNAGLTKETDKRIVKMGWSQGLTKETDLRVKKMSISKLGKSVENISKANIRRLLNGTFKVRGYFFSQKNNKKFGYRSSWELLAMKIFEQLSTVVKYDYEVLSISYIDEKGQKRYTVPDFIVYYSDGSKEIIEVKPQFKIECNLDNTKLKLEAMSKFAKNNNYTFSVWTEKELNI